MPWLPAPLSGKVRSTRVHAAVSMSPLQVTKLTHIAEETRAAFERAEKEEADRRKELDACEVEMKKLAKARDAARKVRICLFDTPPPTHTPPPSTPILCPMHLCMQCECVAATARIFVRVIFHFLWCSRHLPLPCQRRLVFHNPPPLPSPLDLIPTTGRLPPISRRPSRTAT